MADQPRKLYYSISEVAELTGVKAHVLRYWESEFPTLRPRKTRSGSRRYRQGDIDEVLAIKSLLYDEGYKIAGAKKMRRKAREEAKTREAAGAKTQYAMSFDAMDMQERIGYLQRELTEILRLVKELADASDAAPRTTTGQRSRKGKA